MSWTIYLTGSIDSEADKSDAVTFGKWYTSRMKDYLESRLGCSSSADDEIDADDYVAAEDCELAAFLIWSAPVIASITGFVFSFLLHVLAVAAHEALHQDKEVCALCYEA